MAVRNDIEQLFRDNFAEMYSLAMQLLHDRDASRDIVHDVFASLLTSDRGIVSRYYLLKSVRNACLNYLRSMSVRERFRNMYELDVNEADEDGWPDEATIERIREIVDGSLSEKCRRVVCLRFTDGLSYKEVSEALGITEVAVYKHLRHALDVLRLNLKNNV